MLFSSLGTMVTALFGMVIANMALAQPSVTNAGTLVHRG